MAVLFCLPLGSWGIFWQSSAHFQKQLQVLPETMLQILPDTGSDNADDNQRLPAFCHILSHSEESQV